jgi:hypothetical protein
LRALGAWWQLRCGSRLGGVVGGVRFGESFVGRLLARRWG